MLRWALATTLILLAQAARGGAPNPPCPIVPVPRVYKESGRTAELLAEGAAVVVGAKASEPERYGAERLRGLVARRFKRQLPILAEGEAKDAVRQAILVGQRPTNAWLDRLCREKGFDLSAETPGQDGFIIEVADDGGRQVIVIGGSDERGAIYGQDAFFDLLRAEDGRVAFPVASVRDWPSIAWRGRPHFYLREHLEPGVFEAYVRARVNFIDVRDAPGEKALYGFPADYQIDEGVVKRIVAEAHRRAIFVYGTVICGVRAGQHDAVLAAFQKLISLGVDGLWVSFDDRGAGQSAEALIARVLALGKSHGMTGWRIATTPPIGSYGRARSDFNQAAAKVPGFADARWFLTHMPLERQEADAREIGLARKPSWWHNWPRIPGGFTNDGYLGDSMRADGRPAYVDLCVLTPTVPWSDANNAEMASVPQHADAVMMWGMMPEEYSTRVHGIWAWHPEKHDWARTRRAVYADVFGPANAAAAAAYDDKLDQLRSLCILPSRGAAPGTNWPARLALPANRDAALKLLDEMQALAAQLGKQAPAPTLIPPERLETVFLEPMRALIPYARKMATLDYIEYQLPDFECRMDELLGWGKTQDAEKALAEARTRLLPAAARVPETLAGLKGAREYAQAWEKRFASLDYWVARDKKRLEEADGLFQVHLRIFGKPDYGNVLMPLPPPPLGEPAATLAPAEWLRGPRLTLGDVGIGQATPKGQDFAGIVFHDNALIHAGDFGEVQARLPVPAMQGRPVLDLCAAEVFRDLPPAGTRFAQLHVNGALAWERDLTMMPGKPTWVSAQLPGLPQGAKELELRFRVVNKSEVPRGGSATFLGPVRLRAVQGDAPPKP